MARALIVVLSASLVVSAAAAVAADRPATTSRGKAAATPIVLRGRQGAYGPWRRYLWLKLDRLDITSFSVCGVYHGGATLPPTCRSPRGVTLPGGSRLRLEQGRGAGWRTVALSTEASLQAILSNTVAGNRRGAVSYRVTLRSPSGKRLATSNTFKVFWQAKK